MYVCIYTYIYIYINYVYCVYILPADTVYPIAEPFGTNKSVFEELWKPQMHKLRAYRRAPAAVSRAGPQARQRCPSGSAAGPYVERFIGFIRAVNGVLYSAGFHKCELLGLSRASYRSIIIRMCSLGFGRALYRIELLNIRALGTFVIGFSAWYSMGTKHYKFTSHSSTSNNRKSFLFNKHV